MRGKIAALGVLWVCTACPADDDIGYKPIDGIGIWCEGEGRYMDEPCENEGDGDGSSPADESEHEDQAPYPKPDIGEMPPVP